MDGEREGGGEREREREREGGRGERERQRHERERERERERESSGVRIAWRGQSRIFYLKTAHCSLILGLVLTLSAPTGLEHSALWSVLL